MNGGDCLEHSLTRSGSRHISIFRKADVKKLTGTLIESQLNTFVSGVREPGNNLDIKYSTTEQHSPRSGRQFRFIMYVMKYTEDQVLRAAHRPLYSHGHTLYGD